ncbi:hypothetical protein RRG08_009913 [Elysia crispata]|uniref:Uncharacterized protein n=1 Tax=Elysia crispata TaxID=231223 RepID=A0AAE1E302_9GAST|nr:hypothetical protein RRG08_009913 [Elysia crispata]
MFHRCLMTQHPGEVETRVRMLHRYLMTPAPNRLPHYLTVLLRPSPDGSGEDHEERANSVKSGTRTGSDGAGVSLLVQRLFTNRSAHEDSASHVYSWSSTSASVARLD